MRVLFFVLTLFLSVAYAHQPVKVQSLQEAVAKYTPSSPDFQERNPAGTPKFIKNLWEAELGDLALFKFHVKADWGPIHGLVAIRDGRVLGLEILVFTEHSGSGVTKAVFLDQFKSLTRENHLTALIKALPKEPKTSLALKEVITTIFARHGKDSPSD